MYYSPGASDTTVEKGRNVWVGRRHPNPAVTKTFGLFSLAICSKTCPQDKCVALKRGKKNKKIVHNCIRGFDVCVFCSLRAFAFSGPKKNLHETKNRCSNSRTTSTVICLKGARPHTSEYVLFFNSRYLICMC